MEFGALNIFCAVAAAETLTSAADRLNITQSAVSQAIKKLEVEAGTELVVRRSRPTKLTPSGERFRQYAEQVLAETVRMKTDIEMVSRKKVRQLRIGMIDSFGDIASLEFVQRFKPYAEKLLLRTGVTAPLTKALIDRDLDVLVTSDPIENQPEFMRFPILRDPFVMIVPENFCGEDQVSPDWLAQNIPFIRYSRETRIGALTGLIGHRLRIRFNTQYELDNTQTLMRFVQAGQGWSMTTCLCLIRYPRLLEGVRVVPLAKGANARYISLFCRENELGELPEKIVSICKEICDEHLSPKVQELVPWPNSQTRTISDMPVI